MVCCAAPGHPDFLISLPAVVEWLDSLLDRTLRWQLPACSNDFGNINARMSVGNF